MIFKVIRNKELRWTFLTQFTTLLGALGFTKILTFYLPKEEFGYFSLSMSLVTLVSMLPFTALNEAVGRYISIYQEKGVLEKMIFNIIILSGIIYTPYVLAGITSYFFVDSYWRDLIFILLLLTIFEIVKNTILKIENNLRNRKFVALSRVFEFSVKLGVSFILFTFSFLDIQGIFIIMVGIDLSIIIYQFYKRRKGYALNQINKANLMLVSKHLFSFSWPLIIWSIFGWFQVMGSRWIINYFMNKESVAEFSLMSSIALLPSTAITGILGAFLLPIIYQKTNEDSTYAWKAIKKIIPFQIIIYVLLIMGFFWLGKDVVILLSSKKYTNAAWMLPLMMIGSSLFAISQVYTYEIFAHKVTKHLLLSTIIPGLFSIFGGFLLIKYFQLEGAMMTFILTYVLYFIFTMIAAFRFHRRIKTL